MDTAYDFVAIVQQARADRPAGEAWARIGGYFDLGLFLGVDCTRVSGDGSPGSVRRVGDAIIEPMVGATEFSYTYAQTVGPMSIAAYHGSVECRPVSDTESEIIYTLVYDQAQLSEDRREAERERLQRRFGGAVEAMKRVAEA